MLDEKEGWTGRCLKAATSRQRAGASLLQIFRKPHLAEGQAVAGDHDFDAPDPLKEKGREGEPHLSNEAAPLFVRTKGMNTSGGDGWTLSICLACVARQASAGSICERYSRAHARHASQLEEREQQEPGGIGGAPGQTAEGEEGVPASGKVLIPP
jgi:hypothetical protein